MNKKLWYSIPVILIGAIGFLFFSFLGRDRVPAQTLLGKQIPLFETVTLDGTPQIFSNEHLKGRFVILKFFASWCKYCRMERPVLQKLASIPTIDLVGVGMKDDIKNLETWQSELKKPYKEVLIDFEGNLGHLFFVKGVPETFVINPNGVVIFHHQGPLTNDIIRDKIIPLVSGK